MRYEMTALLRSAFLSRYAEAISTYPPVYFSEAEFSPIFEGDGATPIESDREFLHRQSD